MSDEKTQRQKLTEFIAALGAEIQPKVIDELGDEYHFTVLVYKKNIEFGGSVEDPAVTSITDAPRKLSLTALVVLLDDLHAKSDYEKNDCEPSIH